MINKDSTETIKIRICDLHGIFVMLSLCNKGAINSAWDAIEIMMKNAD